MKRNGLSNSGGVGLISFFLVAVFFTGCAAQGFMPRNMAGVSRYFDADKNTVWGAVIQSVEGIPLEISDREKGVLKHNG